MTSTTAVRLLAETTGLRNRMLTLCAPAAVVCPYCHALAGYECLSKTGNRPLSYHAPRRRLVDALPDDDARLHLLLDTYTRLAQDTSEFSLWNLRAATLRVLLDQPQETAS